MEIPKNDHEEQLSSWKSIAGYLHCRPRTCIRWEKTLGLPVHRLEGAQKSRVFAYKHELDAWLHNKLKNGHGQMDQPERPRRSRTLRPWIMGAVTVSGLIILLLFVLGLHRRAITPPATDEVPRSTGPFDIYPGDIITTEFLPEGKLRVWRKKNRSEFFVSWMMAPLRHTSFAVGDLDGDPDPEIVAPAYCREFFELNGERASRIRYFLNAYKRGVGDWWKTTFYDLEQCVYEPEDFEFSEICIGNLDGKSGNEIALITASELSLYRYDRFEASLKLIAKTTSFLEDVDLHLRALRISDVDGDGGQEILILGNEWQGGAEIDNKGWLVVLDWKDGGLAIDRRIELDASVLPQSLRCGDVVPGGVPEAVFPLSRKAGIERDFTLAGWNITQGIVFEMPMGKDEKIPRRTIPLDVGNVMEKVGDEVVYAASAPNELVCCFWNGRQLIQGPKYSLTPKAELTNVVISPVGDPGNKFARILACGSIKTGGKSGSFYVEVVDYGNGFIPVWLRTGGEESEIKVSYAAFGK